MNHLAQQRLIQLYTKNPTATNYEGANHMNHLISARSVSDYLLRNNFTRKKVSDEPENYPNERNFDEVKEFLDQFEDISWGK